MKKTFVIVMFLVNLALLVFIDRAFCYQGEVEDISKSKYFPAVKQAISEASWVMILVSQ